MLKKALAVTTLLLATLLSSAPREVSASTCYEDCQRSYQTCPTECGASPSSCYDGYLVCVDSCDRHVGPWLIC